LEYQLHVVGPTVLAGMVLHPLEKAREVLKFYREYNSKIPEEMSAWASLLTSPDGHRWSPFLRGIPEALKREKRVVRPFKQFGSPVADLIQPMPYVMSQSLIDQSLAAVIGETSSRR
jgi:hypothetical protein